MDIEAYTVSELATKVGLSRAYIYQLIHEGKLAAKRDSLKNKIYITMSDWKEYNKLHLVDYQIRQYNK